ncbi:MAG: competence/damage-inducible protein A [Deltaproteobacteria bacterium]|nr:competence/damage-inducible protein A [Deltaproteobacteria bacterium]
MAKTAGIVIIGNEVLSGKTHDTNSYFLCTELRRLGVEVQRISTVQDVIEIIGAEVAAFSKRFDFVFTTGGVGPTHDDVTIEGIAHGFGVNVVRHSDIERRMRQRLGADVNEARLRMANVPEGSKLLATEALFAPVVNIHNVYIFPDSPGTLSRDQRNVPRHALFSQERLSQIRRGGDRGDAQRCPGEVSRSHVGFLPRVGYP